MKFKDFPFKTALNASTLRPFKLAIPEQIKISREAGYEGIELWMRDIYSYVESGGSIEDIGKLSIDLGIEVFDGIALIKWADKDPAVRAAEMEKAKREMEMLRTIGCGAMASPPFGDTESVTTEEYAEHFSRLHRAGMDIGVEPILEIWGHRGNVRTIAKALL